MMQKKGMDIAVKGILLDYINDDIDLGDLTLYAAKGRRTDHPDWLSIWIFIRDFQDGKYEENVLHDKIKEYLTEKTEK